MSSSGRRTKPNHSHTVTSNTSPGSSAPRTKKPRPAKTDKAKTPKLDASLSVLTNAHWEKDEKKTKPNRSHTVTSNHGVVGQPPLDQQPHVSIGGELQTPLVHPIIIMLTKALHSNHGVVGPPPLDQQPHVSNRGELQTPLVHPIIVDPLTCPLTCPLICLLWMIAKRVAAETGRRVPPDGLV
ncbi:MAG: hypothetical protein Q9195_008237 [Heterodermia aff. obscurata]